jgi:hypothetical protein
MNLYELKPGDRIVTRDGAIAAVVSETVDGQWIKVRYLECAEDPSVVGTEDLCHEDEVIQLPGSK